MICIRLVEDLKASAGVFFVGKNAEVCSVSTGALFPLQMIFPGLDDKY